MQTLVIVVIAALIVVPVLIGLAFKLLWKVPAADEAHIVTGAGALVLPIVQKAQYLSLKADKAILEVEGVDAQKIPVGVRGVAIFKVGDDAVSITNATTRFLHA